MANSEGLTQNKIQNTTVKILKQETIIHFLFYRGINPVIRILWVLECNLKSFNFER